MKTRVKTTLRVGRIHYLNTLPFYHRLTDVALPAAWPTTWETGVPTKINRKMRLGQIDLAPISSLEYLNHQGEYLLLPDLSIGARDFSGSVLLLSRERIEGLNGATISLTPESLSAAALVKILLKFKYRFKNQFRLGLASPAELLQKFQACLVIGDQALFFRPKEFVYKTDLSELWWDWTGLPFCFAVWAVRRKFYEEEPEAVRAFHQRLKDNLEENLQDLEKLLREGLGMTLVDERFPTVFGYLFNLSYGLDPAIQEGLVRFFELAHKLGLSPRPRRFEFIETG